MIKTTTYCTILWCFIFQAQSKAQSGLQVNLGGDKILCLGSYTELNAAVSGGIAPYTFKWYPDDELTSGTSKSVIATPSKTGIFKVIVTDNKGNTARDEVKIEINPRPKIQNLPLISIEPGQSAQITIKVTGGTTPYTYSWRPMNGLNDYNSNTVKVQPSASTTYTVVVKDSKNCSETRQIPVNVETLSISSYREKK
jgi:hypothetical protein